MLTHYWWLLGYLDGALALLAVMMSLAFLLEEPAKSPPAGAMIDEVPLSRFGRYLAELRHRHVIIASLFNTGMWSTLYTGCRRC